MRSTLIAALIVSLVIHLALLFGAELDLSLASAPTPMPLQAELKAPAAKPAPVARPKRPSAANKKPRPQRPEAKPVESVVSDPVVPAALPESDRPPLPEQIAEPPFSSVDPLLGEPLLSDERFPEHLPPRGAIQYRVDSGDSGFEIGVSRHDWEIADGKYRLVSDMTLKTLILTYRIESESVGTASAEGLRPDQYIERRNGKEGKGKAVFDWTAMTLRLGNKEAQALDHGAQDFLSFAYQLGYLNIPEQGVSLPIVIARKYRVYRIEVVGEEKIEVPAGSFRALHLRAPGAKALDLWLAYDYSMLPVKIRFDDGQYILVQTATKIQLNPSGKLPGQPSPP